jgi:MtaA/CmuA family methyltransferase
MNGRERILRTLDGSLPDHLGLMPITMMFAADTIGAKYGSYARDHTVLAEAQFRTAAEYRFDHVSGITETREAPDCGAAVRFFEDQPYALDEERACLADKSVLREMSVPDPLSAPFMRDRIEGIACLKAHAGSGKIVEGWVEGPCGAAADLRGINRLMLDFYDDPEFVHALFSFVLELGQAFGRAQVAAGAEIIGIGDPASSLIGPRFYEQFAWPYQKRLVESLQACGARVRLHICGNIRRILPGVARLGCDILDVDSMVSLAEVRAAAGPDLVLLGGIDPVRTIQNGTPAAVAEAAAECHRQAGPRYILGGGCEIPRGTPRENILALADYASEHTP